MTTFKQEHSISTLEIRLQLQYDDFNACESKAQGYTNMSAILIAVLGLLDSIEGNISAIEKVIIILFLMTFVWVFYFSLLTLRRYKWKAPMGTSKAELEKFRSFAQTSIDEAYLESMFNTYSDCLEENRTSLIIKNNNLSKAEIGVYVEISLILILVLSTIFF